MTDKDHKLNNDHRGPAEDARADRVDSETAELFGSAIGRMVVQYQAALRQGLDKEIQDIVNDFQKASVGSNEIVAKRMRSRIEELVSEEVRRVFDNTLYRAERTLADPVRARAADLGGSDLLRRGVAERFQRQGKPSNRKPRADMPGRDDTQPAAAADDLKPSRISGSVPQGYPRTRTGPEHRYAQDEAETPPYEDQEATTGHAEPVPLFGRPDAEYRESDGAKSPAPATPASWVFPSPSPSQPQVNAETESHSQSYDEAEYGNDDMFEDTFISPDRSFEPDDEVDPFVSSLDDGPGPETESDSAEDYGEEDTSEIPESALTAVLSDNMDLTTVAHDSREVVHVASVREQSDEDRTAADAGPTRTEAPPEDELTDTAPEPLAAPSPSTDIPAELATEDGPEIEGEKLDPPAEEQAPKDQVAQSSNEEAVTSGPDPLQELPNKAEESASQAGATSIPADDISKVANQANATATVAADAGEMPEAAEAPNPPAAAQEPVQEVTASASPAAEAPEIPGPVSTADSPPPAVPGSIEIENGQGEGEELPESTTFEGTIRLNVEAPGCIKEIVHFVRELRQKPELRLLRLVGNNKEGVDIWLGLREPLRIRTILPAIEGVSISVRPLPHVGAQDEKLLGVRMTRITATAEVSEVS